MKAKYVATIMERVYQSAGKYVFLCRNAIVGNYDEEIALFTDVNGNEYNYMLTESSLSKDVPYSVYNIQKIEDMEKQIDEIGKDIGTKDLTLEDKIGEYESLCQNIIFHVGYIDEYVPFLYMINTAALEGDAVVQYKKLKTGEDEEEIEQEVSEEKLNKLMLDAIDGKYTKKELEEMIDALKDAGDYIETAVSVLETKVDAIEQNRDFKEVLKEKCETPENVVKKPKVVPKKKEKKEEKKEEKIEIKKPERIDIDDLFKKVTKVLIAQDEPTLRVITELARKELTEKKKREGILLTGQSGCGKTEMIRQIAKNTNKVLYIVNSTKITSEGYVGTDIEQILWDLYIKCDRNIEKTEHAIIYFDEIDKKGSEKRDQVNARGVLNELLPFIEGSTYNAAPDSKSTSPSVKIDTSNITVIFGGAYADVYKNLLVKNQIGFDHDKTSKPVYRKAETKDFVEHGMMTNEFMGRVTVIKLNDLELDDLKRVLLESEESAIKVEEEAFRKLGVKITFTDGYINRVAEKAYDKKTGARGLNTIVDESTWKAFEEVYTNEDVYREVILTEETADDCSKYKLLKKRKKR